MPYYRESEFITIAGVPRNGTCGPNALAMAESAALGRYVWTGAVFACMLAAGRCDASGAATIWQLQAQALADGMTVTGFQGFQGAPWPGWLAWSHTATARGVAIIETSNGKALVDSISGLSENAVNLRYHFILLCAWHPGGMSAQAGRVLPPGFWAADGANRAVGNVLQFYPVTVLQAADPRAGLAIAMQIKEQPPMATPQGWAWDNTTLTAPNGIAVEPHIAAMIRATVGWDASNTPIAAPNDNGNGGLEQGFVADLWGYDVHSNDVYQGDAGRQLYALRHDHAQLQAQYQAAQAEIAALHAQIQQLQAVPPAASVALSEVDQTKLSIMNQLIALVKAA